MPDPALRLKTQLEALGRQFQEDLPLRLAEMREALPGASREEAQSLQQLRQASRLLSEAAGLFALGSLARSCESLAQLLQLGVTDREELEAALAQIEARIGEGRIQTAVPEAPRPAELYALLGPGSVLLPPAEHLATFGLELRVFRRVEALVEALAKGEPVALLLEDAGMAQADWESFQARQRARTRPVPTLVVSARMDLPYRLRALRAGAATFLPAPVDPLTLLEALDPYLPGQDPDPYRILALVEDPLQGAWLRTILEGDGLRMDTCIGPEALLEALDEVRPDLLLLPRRMEACTAPELLALVRQEASFMHLGALVLDHEEPDEAGREDSLLLPSPPERVVATVRQRARRGRHLHSLVLRDPLTGLLNQGAFLETLQGELARSIRRGAPLTLALLDLDHVRQVNEQHGHGAGDQAIRSLARLLQQRLRKTDLLGRYGGESLALLLPDTALEGACHLVEDLRVRFKAIAFPFSGQEVHLTFSAGIAAYPPFRDPDMLALAADNGLDQAKRAGRDRVETVDPH